MVQNKNLSNNKIKCPLCNFKFIPEAFHVEKTHYETVESKGELTKFLNEKHQVVIKPFSSIKGSRVTYCPECGFIIKFVTEVGRKVEVEDASRIKKWAAFKEFGKNYKYDFTPQDKPFMDYLDYFIEKVDKIKNDIKKVLDEVDFSHWGNPYREWKRDKAVDDFKFLIRFYTNLEDYCNTQVDDPKNKDMEEKINELNLTEDLETTLQNIRNLRNKIVHEAYEINEEEEILIEKAFIQFVSHLVIKQLKPLELGKIKVEPEYSFIDVNKINHEVQGFLNLYLGSTLRIKDFNKQFFIPLLEDLGISSNIL